MAAILANVTYIVLKFVSITLVRAIKFCIIKSTKAEQMQQTSAEFTVTKNAQCLPLPSINAVFYSNAVRVEPAKRNSIHIGYSSFCLRTQARLQFVLSCNSILANFALLLTLLVKTRGKSKELTFIKSSQVHLRPSFIEDLNVFTKIQLTDFYLPHPFVYSKRKPRQGISKLIVFIRLVN